jgi:hypothetical protein
MKTAAIVCHGFFGDHLFASSIAHKLIEEQQFESIDIVVGFPQLIPLFKFNPYISNVIFDGVVGPSPKAPTSHYDKVIQLGTLSLVNPPTIDFQLAAGVQHPSPEFEVYTDPDMDAYILEQFSVFGEFPPVVAVMNNWTPKAFGYTEEEYWRGIDVPNMGYGGRYRDVNRIIDALREQFIVVPVGTPPGVTQFNVDGASRSFLEEASILKHCDYFVGQEGGLYNLAAGVGCKTVISAEFVAQLYGPNGCIRKLPEPKLGAHWYFPNGGHSFLSPFLTDDELIETTTNIILNDTKMIYDWKTNTTSTFTNEMLHEQPV